MTADRVLLYEQPPLRQVSGGAIRPGGLELTDYALDFCGLAAGAWALDAGCGQGVTVEHLISRRHMHAIGIDPSAVLLHSGQQREPNLPLVQGVGEALPVAPDYFDVVLAECTLSLMDMETALAEFGRVLRTDGWLIVTDLYVRHPEQMNALQDLPVRSCLGGAIPRETLLERVRAQGFTVRLWEDHTDMLKVFAARLIWEHGSLAQFWQCAVPQTSRRLETATALAKPGYYLLIAQKDHRKK